MKKYKVLIVAKPWSGGLYKYYFNAMKRSEKIDPIIYFTYPIKKLDYFRFKINKNLWYESLITNINNLNYDFGFFINFVPILNTINNNKKNILYLTDKSLISEIELNLFDKIFISDMGYKDKFSRCKNFCGELPFGFDKLIHKEVTNLGSKKTICLIANKDQRRNKWLQSIQDSSNFPHIYGNYYFNDELFLKYPFKFHPKIQFECQSKVYSEYLISLNIHAKVLKQGTNMRTFEAAGSNIAQLVEKSNGIENFFEPNNEILTFDSIDEYSDNLNMLKTDNRMREKLKKNALKRALNDHTYEKRLEKIFHELI